MVKKVRRTGGDVPVTDLRHTDTRTNLPTPQLAAYMSEDEKKPRSLRWPRDPSVDPQLVWTGKDSEAPALETQSVPLFIQERIVPESIIRDLHAHADDTAEVAQLDLFGGSERLSLEQKIEFYKHAEGWTNRLVLGDSLLVMSSLADREGMRGKVQMVYMDPPYGISYGSNWQVSTRERTVKDGQDLTGQPEQVRAYRDTWELGIHSYLAYLRDRISVSRELLNETGAIFVQISDENVHLVRNLLDEVFGRENYVSTIRFVTASAIESSVISRSGDNLLFYARDKKRLKVRQLREFVEKAPESGYRNIELPDGTRRTLTQQELATGSMPEGARLYIAGDPTSQGSSGDQPFKFNGEEYRPPRNRHWTVRWPEGMNRLAQAGRLQSTKNSVRYIRFADDNPTRIIRDLWLDTGTGNFTDDKVYVVQTNTKVISRALLLVTDPGDLVLDPTIGSGSTAIAAEQWGRRWIGIDTSRVASSVARTRIMSHRYPAYVLRDTPRGQELEAEAGGSAETGPTTSDVRRGFVYERVPNIGMDTIANTPGIEEGMSSKEIQNLVSKNADSVLLFDRPLVDPKAVRVSGPFTVESLSPHRQLVDELGESHDAMAESGIEAAKFADDVRDQLRRAGVRYPRKGTPIRFETLDAQPGGTLIHAVGTPVELGNVQRVAVSIGPRFGTVTRQMVLDASKEAAGLGADMLVVCGFAYEADAQEIPNIGRLEVVCARMNSDLLVEGLKATKSGELFTVFGEPDIDIRRAGDLLEVEIRGIDVFDPTSGEIRADATTDISAWFIDTDYNSEAFFVRHAYFLGDEQPYERLQKALKGEISPESWDSLYSATSRKFLVPKTGKIAIKVINHFGDEVMKVYPIA